MYPSINASSDPGLAEKYLEGTLTTLTCEECGFSGVVEYPMLYHDLDKKFSVFFAPDSNDRAAKLPNTLPAHLHPDMRDVYSWWSNRFGARARNVGWRIDYAFVDSALVPNIAGAEIHTDVKGSDHCPISIELEPPFAPLPIKKKDA